MSDGTLRFDGREIPIRDGDTIATAIYRAGVRVFSRSFKYHRPRGLLCGTGRCANCLMQVGPTPNVRACVTPAQAGLEVRHQNAWPSLEHDLLAVNDRLSFLLPPGFYYKTFIRPRRFWPLYEGVLRRAAGLGRIDVGYDPDERYDKVHRHTDVLVVGGGPAGLSAALAAAEAGADVILADEQDALGGHLRWEHRAPTAPDETVARVERHPRIEVFSQAVAFGVYEGGLVPLQQGTRMIGVRCHELVVATGRHECPLVFPDNDRPGVMLASAVRRLLRQGVRPGERAVVVTTGSEGYALAAELSKAGLQLSAVVDSRPAGEGSANLADLLRDRQVTLLSGHGIVRARGKRQVTGAVVAPLDEGGRAQPALGVELQCDLIVIASVTAPEVALLRQSGCSFDLDETGEPRLRETAPHVHAAGAVLGTSHVVDQILEGELAGLAAARAAGVERPDLAERELALRGRLAERRRGNGWASHRPVAPVPASASRGGGKAFLCTCEDITADDVAYAVDEGFDHAELVKRYLTVSMGPCQGKMCSRVAGELCAAATGRTLAATGATTARPPVLSVPLGVLAGRRLEPVQRTPMHERHERSGAVWMDAGTWRRPRAYGDPADECRAVRERVGIIDVSTLGKLDVQGRDAARLLEKVYTHRFATLPQGRVRYAVACDDGGIVLDDGTVARLGPERFFVTTTTSGVGQMESWLRWWTEGTGWCAHVVNVTSSYAGVNLAGPRARDVLAKLTDADLSTAVLPYLGAAERVVAGIPTLLLRIGFVGELGFEMHFPADYGEAMWDALLEAGAEFGIRPFGVEAQRILRLEKGHLIVTQDTDALTTVLEADIEWACKFDKEDFVGMQALRRLQERGLRQRLVGFEVPAGGLPNEGDQVLDGRGRPVGRVTSARRSPTLDRVIGLAWLPLEGGLTAEEFSIRSNGGTLQATVVAIPFYDPSGTRMRS
jgi:sarcosine oxidase subunit alpha